MAGIRYYKDKTGKLKKFADKIIKSEKDYLPLKHLEILFVWREGKPKRDPDGGWIAAEASVLSARNRDIFGFDAQIEVSIAIWDTLSPEWRRRLIWHELRHLEVEMEGDGSGKLVPARDKAGRIVISLVPHDISLRTFKAEIDKFGIDTDDLETFRFITSRYRQVRKGRLKKYARPGSLREESEAEESPPPPRKTSKKKRKKKRTSKAAAGSF